MADLLTTPDASDSPEGSDASFVSAAAPAATDPTSRRLRWQFALMAAASLGLATDLTPRILSWHAYYPIVPLFGWPLVGWAAYFVAVCTFEAALRPDDSDDTADSAESSGLANERAEGSGVLKRAVGWIGSVILLGSLAMPFVTAASGVLISLAIALFANSPALRTAGSMPRRIRAVAGATVLLLYATFDHLLLQPWVWQFALLTLFLMFDDARSLRWAMRLTVSIYLFSALSKFDPAFFDGLGQVLGWGLLKPLGLDGDDVPLRSLAMLMPAIEAAAGLLLLFRPTRTLGVIVATLMHVGLLLALGPWGLDHYSGVLLWNVAFIPLVGVQFFRNDERLLEWPASFGLGGVVAAALLLLPGLEPFGLWDHWPGWSVYSTRSSRVTLEIVPAKPDPEIEPNHPPRLDGFPFLGEPAPLADYVPVKLEAWCFAVRRQPPYPQERYKVAIAAAFLSECGTLDAFRLTIRRPSRNRFAAEPIETQTITTEAELNALLRSYWLNTQPLRPVGLRHVRPPYEPFAI